MHLWRTIAAELLQIVHRAKVIVAGVEGRQQEAFVILVGIVGCNDGRCSSSRIPPGSALSGDRLAGSDAARTAGLRARPYSDWPSAIGVNWLSTRRSMPSPLRLHPACSRDRHAGSELGKPVFAEKPIVAGLPGRRSDGPTAAASGRATMVDFNF